MPVTAPLLTQSIFGQFSAVGFSGTSDMSIASSIGNGLATHIVTPNLVSCLLNGTAGPTGSITSIAVIGLVPSAMSSLMLSKASSSKSFTGRDLSKFFNAVSNGICAILQGMILSGISAGIAVGIGTGSFTALNEQVLTSLMSSFMLTNNLTGTRNLDLVECISFGIVTHLTSVTFSLTVTGVIAPVAPAGPIAVVGIPSILNNIS